MNQSSAITQVPGIKVGHATNSDALTGCTVILCQDGAVAGIEQRGGAPGTRETDLLRPMHLVENVHAILLSGGSAFGLDAASGVMKYLEEKNIGFNTGVACVPIVPAAILFDLGIGEPNIRPDANMGYEACKNASSDSPEEGNVGAGTGCTVGKIFGLGQSMKSGIGTASINIGAGIILGTIVAVNAFGDVIDPKLGKIIAGVRTPQVGPGQPESTSYFANTLTVMQSMVDRTSLNVSNLSNTVLGVVATNAKLDKSQANKVAQMAHNGLARTIQPANTMLDGDTVFALSTGKKHADINIIGAYASELMAAAVVRAVWAAISAVGLPAARDVPQEG